MKLHQTIGSESGSSVKERKNMKTEKYTAISLFSGAAGLDIGLKQAGFKTLACVELNDAACETIRTNRNAGRFDSDVRVFTADVTQPDLPEQVMREVGLQPGELDFLCGGSPCQSFSRAGKQKGLDDSRGKLVFELLRWASILKPKCFMLENVTGIIPVKLLSKHEDPALQHWVDVAATIGETKNASVLEVWAKAAAAIGYTIDAYEVDAADYGAAHHRP
ncbi:MAG: DNA cytosine methyltransferase [bacterium]